MVGAVASAAFNMILRAIDYLGSFTRNISVCCSELMAFNSASTRDVLSDAASQADMPGNTIELRGRLNASERCSRWMPQ